MHKSPLFDSERHLKPCELVCTCGSPLGRWTPEAQEFKVMVVDCVSELKLTSQRLKTKFPVVGEKKAGSDSKIRSEGNHSLQGNLVFGLINLGIKQSFDVPLHS